MELLGYKELVGNMATVVTIVNFLVGSQVCYEFVTKRSTGSASPMTFLVGVLMTFAWFSYGVLREDHSIQLVNGVGLGKASEIFTILYIPRVQQLKLILNSFECSFIII